MQHSHVFVGIGKIPSRTACIGKGRLLEELIVYLQDLGNVGCRVTCSEINLSFEVHLLPLQQASQFIGDSTASMAMAMTVDRSKRKS